MLSHSSSGFYIYHNVVPKVFNNMFTDTERWIYYKLSLNLVTRYTWSSTILLVNVRFYQIPTCLFLFHKSSLNFNAYNSDNSCSVKEPLVLYLSNRGLVFFDGRFMIFEIDQYRVRSFLKTFGILFLLLQDEIHDQR